nr:GPR endopeptidase [Clostridia bacterium]
MKSDANNFIRYITSDLASECIPKSGIPSFAEHDYGCASVAEVTVSNADEARMVGKPVGHYTTFSFGRPWNMPSDELDELTSLLTANILELAEKAAPDHRSVLIAGLGNRQLTADALGPETVSRINVTRHLKQLDPELYRSLGTSETAALVPGVAGQTGIETLELVRSAVDTVKPDLLVVIDSLAARSTDRLATTIQLTDSGIAPGSGIGNHRKAISKESVGVPVIAIGAPLVVSSATLVYDALEKAGIDDIPPQLNEVLENGRSYFVTPKEADTAVKELAVLISDALNGAFSVIL